VHGSAFGGHLSAAVVSATAEIFVQIFPDTIERDFSNDIGLNLIVF
jgi:hypothetical protein